MNFQVEQGSQYSAHITRGPLLFSYKIPSEWKHVNQDVPGREAPHCDWEVHPTAPWNYAMVDRMVPVVEEVAFDEKKAFYPDHSPVQLTMGAVLAENWQYDNGNASQIPTHVISDSEEVRGITLIPYGASDVRVTEFPVYRLMNQQQRH